MHSWPVPNIPAVPGTPVPLRLYDAADQQVKEVAPGKDQVGMYVCGITPYDSTHLGHAATYLTFDLAYRQLLDNQKFVYYVQNITDVDDPLFERAQRDGVDWRELGHSQIDLFRSDMTSLRVIPPQEYIGAIEAIPEVIDFVQLLLDKGIAYQLEDDEYPDIYAPVTATAHFGYESHYDRAEMEELFAERGGDPQRPGKRDPLDALLWRAARPDEPSWEAPFGAGRPGWHIECSAIATNRLGESFDIQGGGMDLRFPHHEYSAAHAEAAYDVERMAQHYVHAGMIALNGVKMSKSLGNLVFVSHLTAAGHHPAAIRLGVYAGHYRHDRDWSDAILTTAERRHALWIQAANLVTDEQLVAELIERVRSALAYDLDTPTAFAHIDAFAATVLGIPTDAADTVIDHAALDDAVSQDASSTAPVSTAAEQRTQAGKLFASAMDAFFGVEL